MVGWVFPKNKSKKAKDSFGSKLLTTWGDLACRCSQSLAGGRPLDLRFERENSKIQWDRSKAVGSVRPSAVAICTHILVAIGAAVTLDKVQLQCLPEVLLLAALIAGRLPFG